MNGIHHSTGHARSYYAATANAVTDYPVLRGAQTADVCIVGGGFTGVSAALELAERGFSVALLEAHRIGWGASGRNGGQVIGGVVEEEKIRRRLGDQAAKIAWDMGVECVEIIRERVDRYAINCDLKWGYLDVALKDRDMREFATRLEMAQRMGYPHPMRLVQRNDMGSVIGSDRYIGGLVNAGDGHVHPLNLCMGEARAAVDAGANIFEGSPATAVRGGARPVVETEHGSITAGQVIIAGNAYLDGLLPALRGRVLPAGSYIIATEPLPEHVAQRLIPEDMAVCDQRAALDYFRLSADRRLLFGGLCNYSGRDPSSIKGVLQPKMLKVFPELKNYRIDFEWGGYIGISLNRIPQLGRLEGNLYYALGYSGHGVAPTHIAGRVIAEAIAGTAERLDVFDRIRHWKLPGGKWFASPALALGMLYYRLKDWL